MRSIAVVLALLAFGAGAAALRRKVQVTETNSVSVASTNLPEPLAFLRVNAPRGALRSPGPAAGPAAPRAQPSHASLGGVVHDRAGAPMAGVPVALLRDGVVEATTLSDAHGGYRFSIGPGDYALRSVSPSGSALVHGLTVDRGERLDGIDLELAPIARLILRVGGQEQLVDLPLDGRIRIVESSRRDQVEASADDEPASGPAPVPEDRDSHCDVPDVEDRCPEGGGDDDGCPDPLD